MRAGAGRSLRLSPLLLHWISADTDWRVLVDADLRLIRANERASAFLNAEDKDKLFELVDDRLRVTDERVQSELRTCLRCGDAPGYVFVPKSDRHESDQLLRVKMLSKARGKRIFGLRLITSRVNTEEKLGELRDVFGLTPKQYQLIVEMLRGKTADDAAEAMNISIETARSHIRGIYAKLNVASREELFARIRPFYL
ncbi:helix-turn-helix transcriptional regulator [Parasphingopyxis marina]|uniref:Helix-turn-helix transcriptional regulator n=1 Tax=Parasphingopyxis marina TaxID=2761622 RepID=A0A842I1I5_9SPHN|nr:LuxR C-terminal-related transcriptional regulator [Parasphingopyxis marina]MBC2778757.1 helix-turn-helix transcriptional regulator [Parasphingopyxis marina]